MQNKTARRIDWCITQLGIKGGAEKFVVTMAGILKMRGWDISLIVFKDAGDYQAEILQLGINLIELHARSKLDVVVLFRLIERWKKVHPELVHTHLFHAGILGRIAARLSRVPYVLVHQHGPEFNRSRFRTLMDRSTAPLVDQYLVSCQAVANFLRLREKISDSKIFILPNGIDTRAEMISKKPHNWPFPMDRFTIVTTGRLSPEKNQVLLIEALGILHQRGVDFQCLIMGEGDLHINLVDRVNQVGLSEKIVFTGYQPDVRNWLTFCDCFVLPSRWEGISLSLLEAMSAGLPVIATRTGGTPEVIDDDRTGFMIEPGDLDGLVRALERLHQDKGLCRAIGQAARLDVAEKFGIQHIADQLETIYWQLVG